jgi:hypothetical protein
MEVHFFDISMGSLNLFSFVSGLVVACTFWRRTTPLLYAVAYFAMVALYYSFKSQGYF